MGLYYMYITYMYSSTYMYGNQNLMAYLWFQVRRRVLDGVLPGFLSGIWGLTFVSYLISTNSNLIWDESFYKQFNLSWRSISFAFRRSAFVHLALILTTMARLTWQNTWRSLLERWVYQKRFLRPCLLNHFVTQWVPGQSAGGCRNNLNLFATNPQVGLLPCLPVAQTTQKKTHNIFTTKSTFEVNNLHFLLMNTLF